MKSTILLLISAILLGSCSKSKTSEGPSDLTASTTLNVSYGSFPSQVMDVYLPAGRTTSSTKVLVLIHGGGWTSGDKNEFGTYIPSLQSRLPDYAIFNINYRLFNGSDNKFPIQENDVKQAIDFIISKSSEYKISDKFALLGASAGAHLALLQAYKYNSPKVQAVVSFFGPTDLVEFYNNPPSPNLQPAMQALLGTSPSQNISVYQQSSPAFFVNTFSPPTLIMHGTNDQVVPLSQSILLKNKLDASGVKNEYVEYQGEGHGWIGIPLQDSFDRIIAFLAANVK
ncbi:MAG TPA: prolyl oligopeptidase family serine peptidase [Chitinophagaceae bacterium]|nr:prolyl oligopeptidase family serine peptidase [Chitinophagaceae bacterium]